MRNPIFSFPDYCLTGDVTAGSVIDSNFPLYNLRDPSLATMVRLPLGAPFTVNSTNYITITPGNPSKIMCIAIIGHSIPADAILTVSYEDVANTNTEIYTGAAYPAWLPAGYDSPFALAMQPVYPDILIVPDAPIIAQTITITITSSTAANSPGYVTISRIFCGGGFELSTSPVYGMQQGITSDTAMQRTIGGTAYYDVRPQRKTLQLQTEYIPDAEALGHLWQMQRTLGTHGELYFILRPDAISGLERERNMLCHLSGLSPLESVFFNAINTGYQLEEIV